MKLRIDQIAERHGINLSQLQRQTGMTMSKARRYWYNKTGSVELGTLEAILLFFRRFDPAITVADLFTGPGED